MTAMLGNGSFTFFDAVNSNLRDIMLVDLWFRTMQELWDNACRASFRALPPNYQQKVMAEVVKTHLSKGGSILGFQSHVQAIPMIPGC
jgi:hypothetical protein